MPPNIKKAPILIILLTLFFVLASSVAPSLILKTGNQEGNVIYKTLIYLISGCFFMGLAPILMVKSFFRGKLRDFGFNWPKDYKLTLFLSSAVFFLFLPLIIFFSFQADFQSYYILGDVSVFGFILVAGIASFVYYFVEEFFFRGFLFFGLWQKLGYHSFWLNALIFTLFHLGKPAPELFLAFFAALAFCYLSLKTKSFLPAAIIHFLWALILNVLVFSFGSASNGAFHF